MMIGIILKAIYEIFLWIGGSKPNEEEHNEDNHIREKTPLNFDENEIKQAIELNNQTESNFMNKDKQE